MHGNSCDPAEGPGKSHLVWISLGYRNTLLRQRADVNYEASLSTKSAPDPMVGSEAPAVLI